jgi:superfamily II DNA or RNA helicase
MASAQLKTGSELFIVDNSDEDWKVLRYLQDWCELSESIDIATGCFEIGSLIALDGKWQKVDSFRLLMGQETTQRTRLAIEKALREVQQTLDGSIEHEKTTNDFLAGVPAIVEAIRAGKIQCRVYLKKKFHAKTYITHARQQVIGSFGLVGSSNFTYPGLTENIELNVQIAGRQVNALQEWYDLHWEEAQDVTPQVLNIIERHTRDYLPFDVYIKAMDEFFRGHEMTAGEWELADPEHGGSRMYPILDQYQKEGYQALMKIAGQYNGAFLCDGVGLGKTFVGLMVIERLIIHERKRVLLLVPKAARKDVWERALSDYLPHLGGDFSNLVILNHTDLGRGGEYQSRLKRIKEFADAVVIDEAHHFRNLGIFGKGIRRPSRYRVLEDLLDGPTGIKQLFMLTATPVNNSLSDFRHMVELFSRKQEDYFRSTLGISSLRGHFIKMEKELRAQMGFADGSQDAEQTNLFEAEDILAGDILFRALVVQRSRGYVKQSQMKEGGRAATFPTSEDPRVATYSVRKTYGKLLEKFEKACGKAKPLFVLGIYYPLAYYKGSDDTVDPFVENRQKQVVGLIRTSFLKRFESSVWAFQASCDRLMKKLLAWVDKNSTTPHDRKRYNRWLEAHGELLGWIQQTNLNLWGEPDEEDTDEDFISEEMREAAEELNRDEYEVPDILADSYDDLNQLVEFLEELQKFEPKHDDKLKELVRLLTKDPVCKKNKVLIFTEFAETARYIRNEMVKAGIDGVEQIDSSTKKDRSDIICRFAPYYNGTSAPEITEGGGKEIRILVSTDVLSEGLNLQDATRLINYDIHWNPVRLMQRIGRVDRRMNPAIEEIILKDHPEQAKVRGTIAYWNFLPPDDLDRMLTLFTKVSQKTLRISKTFGIEGKKLLRPEDDYDALKNFNHKYEGDTSPLEDMHLEYQDMLKDNPSLPEYIAGLPGRLFSGKSHPKEDAKAVFFCYRLPKPDHTKAAEGEMPWTEEAGETAWYLFDLATGAIHSDHARIVEYIRSSKETPRKCIFERKRLTEIRAQVDKHIKNSYLKRLQAPIGVKPVLKTWMELS